MTMLGIASVFSLILCGLALRANARLRDEIRLPMQWWPTGEITWSAPRTLALAFVPALAVCVFTLYGILVTNVPPRAGQGGIVLPTLIGIGSMFVAVQLLHFWLIKKTLRRNGS